MTVFTAASTDTRVSCRFKPGRVAFIVIIYRTVQHTKVPWVEPRQLLMSLVEGQ